MVAHEGPKTLKETIKEMEDLGLVIDRVIYRDPTQNLAKAEIQFKKEEK